MESHFSSLYNLFAVNTRQGLLLRATELGLAATPHPLPQAKR